MTHVLGSLMRIGMAIVAVGFFAGCSESYVSSLNDRSATATDYQPPRDPSAPEPGTPVGDLQLEGWLDDKPQPLSGLRGQVVVIETFASYCPSCQEETPALIKLQEEWQDRGVTVVGISPEGYEDVRRVEAFAEKLQVPWPVGFGAVDSLKQLGVVFTPTFTVIDREGKFVDNVNKVSHLPRVLEQVAGKVEAGKANE